MLFFLHYAEDRGEKRPKKWLNGGVWLILPVTLSHMTAPPSLTPLSRPPLLSLTLHPLCPD